MRSKKKKVEAPELKLNLGCGRTKLDGYINVDCRDIETADVVYDLSMTPWPWKTGTISEISAIYLLMYFSSAGRMAFMNECFRILKVDGILQIRVPIWTSGRAVSDPMYQWPAVSENTFLVYNKEWREHNEQGHYPIACDFDFTYGYVLDGSLNSRSDDYKQTAVRHYNNAVLDLMVTLKKRGAPTLH